MDSTKRKKEKKMKVGKGIKMNRKANSLMENFQHGNILVFFFVVVVFKPKGTHSAAEGKHGFSNLSPCWGRGLRASLAR